MSSQPTKRARSEAGSEPAEAEAQAEAGIETVAFDGADKELWAETAQSEGWGEVMEIDAELGQQLQSCLTK